MYCLLDPKKRYASELSGLKIHLILKQFSRKFNNTMSVRTSRLMTEQYSKVPMLIIIRYLYSRQQKKDKRNSAVGSAENKYQKEKCAETKSLFYT